MSDLRRWLGLIRAAISRITLALWIAHPRAAALVREKKKEKSYIFDMVVRIGKKGNFMRSELVGKER
jgi:hypothetical protein